MTGKAVLYMSSSILDDLHYVAAHSLQFARVCFLLEAFSSFLGKWFSGRFLCSSDQKCSLYGHMSQILRSVCHDHIAGVKKAPGTAELAQWN